MKLPSPSPRIMILFDQAVFSGTSFIITLLVARSTSVADFGVYSGYVLGVYLAVSAIGAWVIQPFQVLVGQTSQLQSYISFVVWFQLALTLLVSILAFGVLSVFVDSVPFIVVPFAAGFLFHDFGRKLLLALNRPLQTLLVDALASFSMLVATGWFFMYGEGDIYGLMSFFGIAYCFPAVLLLLFIKPFPLRIKNYSHFFSLHAKEGKWLFMTALVQWWSGNLFVVASGVYLGAAALGALRLGQSLFGVLNVLLQTFENYVLPQTAQRITESHQSAIHYLSGITRKAALLFIPVLLVCVVFDEYIMKLAGGSEYAGYGYVLQGLSVLYVFIFLSQPVRLLIRSLLLNRHFFYGYVLSLLFALGLSPFLLEKFQLLGAIGGLIGSQLILMIYWSKVLNNQKLNVWKSFISF